uniref:Ig-like domain-containing protein n=1 Tax=Neogobius melanostomus TaxID=47308 RepID=A0A8C6S9L4_9GOBI
VPHNDGNGFSNTCSLSVGSPAQPFTPFWFSVEPQDTVATRAGPALLNCSAHGGAAASAGLRIEWKKDGTFLSPAADDRRQVLPDGSLLFTHVVHSKHNKPDEGTYQCVATIDSLGSISSRTARLSVAGQWTHHFCQNIVNTIVFKILLKKTFTQLSLL